MLCISKDLRPPLTQDKDSAQREVVNEIMYQSLVSSEQIPREKQSGDHLTSKSGWRFISVITSFNGMLPVGFLNFLIRLPSTLPLPLILQG
ncbi:hypothetical protein CEXT_505221 [Caerostris extrusa]|uniref:Uncharacterized protein n=1 Tax=Caerostris extrusa TaxID=172846 RepID=A0AAV4MUV6_CAEEX|nr:hypothetical protein CEXT_505221 [Caerostris extrusa]